jgi:hypothetical protein
MSADTDVEDAKPLVVSARVARAMLGDIGITHFYKLLNLNELDSYLEGKSRKVVVASIHRLIARRLAESEQTEVPRRRVRKPLVAASSAAADGTAR